MKILTISGKQFAVSVRNWVRYRRVLLLALPVGIIAGLGSVLFYTALDGASSLFLDHMAGYRPPGPGGEDSLFPPSATSFVPWMLLVVPTMGGIISGWLVFTFAPEAEGHGTDAALEAYHFKHARIRGRVPLIKIVSSAVTIGSGGSGGREGPIAQIGAAFGSLFAHRLGLNVQERRILMMSGMSAGIGSIFHAPLAGAIFAAEILYRDIDMEYELLVPSAITSVIAYCVFSLFFGFQTLFVTPPFVFSSAAELLPYTLLAIVVALCAGLYARCFYAIRDLFLKLPVRPHVKPAIGGLLTGVIGFFLPGAIYTGYGVLQQALNGQVSMQLLLAIAAAKVFTTAFSIGSGGSGGVFGPSVVIGGALGGSVGLGLQQLWPGLVPDAPAYVVVGMAGFFASAASTPFSTVIMVSEMTGSYDLLLPAVWVSTIAFLLRGRKGLYEKQIPTRFDTPIHLGDFFYGVLSRLTVHETLQHSDTPPPEPVPHEISMAELLQHMARFPHAHFPVIDDEERYIGVIHAPVVRKLVATRGILEDLKARDFVEPRKTVYPWERLNRVLELMAEDNVDEVVVLSREEGKERVIGILTRADILRAYEKRIFGENESAPVRGTS